MKVLLQRSLAASVSINKRVVGAIDHGLVLLVGIEKNDEPEKLRKMTERVLAYRMFADDEGKMNRNVIEAHGGLLVISQFTLAADTKKGLRPSFSSAAPPDIAKQHFDTFLGLLHAQHDTVATGEFGADMQVSLTNDGPVTFLLEL